MKQTIIIVFLVFALQMLTFGQTTKQNPKQQNSSQNNLPPEIEKILEKWMAAREARDKINLEQIVSDDYEFTTPEGALFNKSQLFSESKLIEIDLPTAPLANLKVGINGDNALVAFTAKNNRDNKKVEGEALERARKNVYSKWLDLENNIRRRADLMPSLYQEIVKVVGTVEDDLLGQMAAARSKLLNTSLDTPNNDSNKSIEQIKAILEADDEFGKILNKVPILQESYPQLRSNEIFQKISDELAGIENRLAVARLDYFAAVRYLSKNLDSRDEKITTIWKKINGKWKLTAEKTEKID